MRGLEWTGLRSILTHLHGLPCPLHPEAETLCGGPSVLGAPSDQCLRHQGLA